MFRILSETNLLLCIFFECFVVSDPQSSPAGGGKAPKITTTMKHHGDEEELFELTSLPLPGSKQKCHTASTASQLLEDACCGRNGVKSWRERQLCTWRDLFSVCHRQTRTIAGMITRALRVTGRARCAGVRRFCDGDLIRAESVPTRAPQLSAQASLYVHVSRPRSI